MHTRLTATVRNMPRHQLLWPLREPPELKPSVEPSRHTQRHQLLWPLRELPELKPSAEPLRCRMVSLAAAAAAAAAAPGGGGAVEYMAGRNI